MAASVLLLSSRITAQNPSSKLDLDGGFSRKSSGSVHFLRPSIWKNNNAVKVSCAISKDNGNAVSVADSVPTVTRSKSVFNSNSSLQLDLKNALSTNFDIFSFSFSF
jgi:acetolactate synthase-1/3 small subunit